ncbi:MAG: ribonuclease BN [Anaerolineaceae bacterium]|nr:ribonuclease BN [Anaerolineaceae bacterium]
MTMLRQWFDLFKTTFQEWSEDNVPRLAAALAYYTAFSIAPMLIVVIAIVGLVYGEQAVEGEIVSQIQSAVGQDAAAVVQDIIKNAYQGGGGVISTIISVGALLLGALGVFDQLQMALNKIWDASPDTTSGWWLIVRRKLISFGMILVIGFLLLVSLLASAFIATLNVYVANLLPSVQIASFIINTVFSFVLTTVLFALIFRFVPDAEIDWSEVWVGATLTTVLFTIGRMVLSTYLANSSVASVYGAAGSFLVILLWVYYSAQIVLFGAEFTQVYARRQRKKAIEGDDIVVGATPSSPMNQPARDN